MSKYYYIDNNNNKIKYVGNIIERDGKTQGIITTYKVEEKRVPITYIQEHDEIVSLTKYFSFIDEDGNLVNIDPKHYKVYQNDNGDYFFDLYEEKEVNLNFNEKEQEILTFMYKDQKTKQMIDYNGEATFNKSLNCYLGKI